MSFQDEKKDGFGVAPGKISELLRSLMAGIPWSESAEGQELRIFSVPSDRTVRIHNPSGRTIVIGEDRDDIEVKACKEARAESRRAAEALVANMGVRGEEIGGALEIDIEIPRKWNRYGRVNLKLLVPRETQIGVSSSYGKVCVQGIRANVRARSSNGSVAIENVVGDIHVSTANAKVRCSCTCGRLVARSSNGAVDLREHSGPVDASTSNGSIHASLESVEGVILATSNGRISLDLPEAVDAELDVRVDNGIIRNDRALEDTTAGSTGRIRGRLGRGGCLIKLRTSNGIVSIR